MFIYLFKKRENKKHQQIRAKKRLNLVRKETEKINIRKHQNSEKREINIKKYIKL